MPTAKMETKFLKFILNDKNKVKKLYGVDGVYTTNT